MFRLSVATALMVTAGAAFASDASYDQEQIREGKVTRAEVSLRPEAKQEKVIQVAKPAPTHTGHTMVCSCSR